MAGPAWDPHSRPARRRLAGRAIGRRCGRPVALREDARTERQGLALGLEASARVVLDWIVLQITYRESHARIASAWPTAFTDVERFAIFSVGVSYN